MENVRTKRRWTGLAFALACLAADPAAGATDPLARIPIEIVRNQVRLPVSIGESRPFRLILDTGMPSRGILLYGSERVDSLGLTFTDSNEVNGAGSNGAVATRIATAARIEAGGLTIENVPIIVLPGRPGLPKETDGIIGAEFFERYAVRIDVEGRRVDLLDSRGLEPAAGNTVVPLRFRQGSAFADARVAVGPGDPVKVDLAIDLGASHSLWLNSAEDGRLAPPANAIATTLGRGLSGDVRGQVGRVRRFEIGDQAFEGVVTVFPVAEHQHPGGFDFKDGFVGAELLTRFNVTFDYPGKRLILERGGRFAEPFEYDMTGMVLDPQGGESRRVNAILPGSPAEEAGIMAADVLTAVDGEPVSTLGPDGIARAFRRDGAEVVVTLQRNATTVEKKLKLRRLV